MALALALQKAGWKGAFVPVRVQFCTACDIRGVVACPCVHAGNVLCVYAVRMCRVRVRVRVFCMGVLPAPRQKMKTNQIPHHAHTHTTL